MAGFAVFMNGRFWVFTEGIIDDFWATSDVSDSQAESILGVAYRGEKILRSHSRLGNGMGWWMERRLRTAALTSRNPYLFIQC